MKLYFQVTLATEEYIGYNGYNSPPPPGTLVGDIGAGVLTGFSYIQKIIQDIANFRFV